ncbi:hypothetical protein ACMDCT_04700 [Halomonadaceae bacterium KBTZ08]
MTIGHVLPVSRLGMGVLLMGALMAVSGCNGASAARPAPELGAGFSYTATSDGNRFRKACPSGVRCDADFDYHALVYEDQRLKVTLFFKPELAHGYSLDNFREHFQYARIQYEASPGSSPDRRILAEARVKGPDVAFRSYTHETLTIGVQGHRFRRVVERQSSDPGCRNGDIAGQCSDMRAVEAPYRITIKAVTPDPEPG